MPSFLQYQLTSTFILLGKYIQSSQYYYSYRFILCYIARVLLSSYYDSYYSQPSVELVNQHIYIIRGYASRVISTIIFIRKYYTLQLGYYYLHNILAIISSFSWYELYRMFVLQQFISIVVSTTILTWSYHYIS